MSLIITRTLKQPDNGIVIDNKICIRLFKHENTIRLAFIDLTDQKIKVDRLEYWLPENTQRLLLEKRDDIIKELLK